MPFYAQFDPSGVVYAVTEAAGDLDAPNVVQVESLDHELLGEVFDPQTGQFSAPPVPEPIEDPRIWWIDVGPFKDRLGMDAPAIAASSHSACKGTMALLDGRKYVDLKDPRVAGMLDVLIATAQPTADPVWPTSGPMTPAKKSAILATPTTEVERHIKGLGV